QNNMRNIGTQTIINALGKCQNIAQLNIDLNCNKISDKTALDIAKQLDHFEQFTHLDLNLSNNMIGPEGAQSIVSTIVKLQNLAKLKLNFSENNINENEAEIIKKILQKNFIKSGFEENKNNIYYDENEIDFEISNISLNGSYINVDFANREICDEEFLNVDATLKKFKHLKKIMLNL
ncbi:hypothetical protein ABPG74_021895, partial [Tetrahymena malaccensis]